jgi:hypothetical protein
MTTPPPVLSTIDRELKLKMPHGPWQLEPDIGYVRSEATSLARQLAAVTA